MEDNALRLYHAIVWQKDPSVPGERINLLARNLQDASAQIRAKFGENAIVSLWNEDDANALL